MRTFACALVALVALALPVQACDYGVAAFAVQAYAYPQAFAIVQPVVLQQVYAQPLVQRVQVQRVVQQVAVQKVVQQVQVQKVVQQRVVVRSRIVRH